MNENGVKVLFWDLPGGSKEDHKRVTQTLIISYYEMNWKGCGKCEA
jgi:hypothetical protein